MKFSRVLDIKKTIALQKAVISTATDEGKMIKTLPLFLCLVATNITAVYAAQCNLDVPWKKALPGLFCEEGYSSTYLNRFCHHLWDNRPLPGELQVISALGSFDQSPSQEKPL